MSPPAFHVPAAGANAVCAFSRRARGFGGFCARRVDARAVKHLTGGLFALFSKFGGFGLLGLGILGSSFLFAPPGNQPLDRRVTARGRQLSPEPVFPGKATGGSVIGCPLVDVVFRKAGEKGLE